MGKHLWVSFIGEREEVLSSLIGIIDILTEGIEAIEEIEEIEAIDITIDKTVNQGNNVNPDKTVNLDSATKIPTPQAYTSTTSTKT